MLPPKLYKYRDTGEYTRRIFENSELWFASPLDFNDPFDCGFELLCGGERNQAVHESVAFELVRERMPELPLQDAIDAAKQIGDRLVATKLDQATDIFRTKLLADTNDKVGILSLSEDCRNILMWSHYAEDHKGICVEFTTTEKPFADAKPVEYSELYPNVNLIEVVTDAKLRALAPWMLTKASDWEYEREWRVLSFDGNGAVQFPLASISGVILGCRIGAPEREAILSWIPNGVAIYQAIQSKNAFTLDIEGPFKRN